MASVIPLTVLGSGTAIGSTPPLPVSVRYQEMHTVAATGSSWPHGDGWPLSQIDPEPPHGSAASLPLKS
jgi:hypothetical protein